MIRVLLVDDHILVRAGYRRLIDAEGDMLATAEVSSSPEALEIVQRQTFDVAVVDLSLKIGNGIETITGILEHAPRIRILVLTMHDSASYVSRAFAAGATGYLTKDCQPDEMLQALRKVAFGQRVLSAQLKGTFSKRSARAADVDLLAQLSEREFEILCAFANSKSIDEIAVAMLVSSKTIANNLSMIRRKLSARSDLELLTIAVQCGLLKIDSAADLARGAVGRLPKRR